MPQIVQNKQQDISALYGSLSDKGRSQAINFMQYLLQQEQNEKLERNQDALQAFRNLRLQASRQGVADLSLEEINAEIRKTREDKNK
ncbi:MAG: hypothetical protein J6M05_02635 [Cardiobacteriaceae bacterium]|nr:hypothetical protein [Cardiobacteriaceae bacterium]